LLVLCSSYLLCPQSGLKFTLNAEYSVILRLNTSLRL
jgi:hypothetical protein